MRRLLPVFILLAGLMGHAQMPMGGITFAGATLGTIAADGTPCTGSTACSSSMSPSAGSMVICSAYTSSFGTPDMTVSDSVNGLYYAWMGGGYDSLSDSWIQNFMLPSTAGGAITPTITFQGSNAGSSIICRAWKNTAHTVDAQLSSATLNALAPLGGSSGTTASGITSANPCATYSSGCSNTLTPSNNNELLTAFTVNHGGATQSQGTNFTAGTRLTSGGDVVSMYDETWNQTTATATSYPFVATSDTWAAYGGALCPSGATTNCMLPYNGIFNDFYGQTNGTAVSTTNLQANPGFYSPIHAGWTACSGSMTYSVGTVTVPSFISPIYVNGWKRSGNTNIAISHTNANTTEGCNFSFTDVKVTSGPGSFAEFGWTALLAGYTANNPGDFCDFGRLGPNTSGDTITMEWYYNAGLNVRWENNSGGTFYSRGTAVTGGHWLTFRNQFDYLGDNYAVSSVGNASGGSTLYTGTFADGANNGLAGRRMVITGLKTAANNTSIVATTTAICSASSTTCTVTGSTTGLNNGDIIWAANGDIPVNPITTFTISGTTLTLSQATTGAITGGTIYIGDGEGAFLVSASTTTTMTVANASGVAETDPGTATGAHVMEIIDCGTGSTCAGTLVGYETTFVRSASTGGGVNGSMGADGSCGMTQAGSITYYAYPVSRPNSNPNSFAPY